MNLLDFYKNHIHRLALALARAQEYGILVDQDAIATLKTEANLRLDKHKTLIAKVAGAEINPASNPQIQKLLYEKLKFPGIYTKDKGVEKLVVDEVALRKLEKRYPDEKILNAIIMFRKESKLISTYLNMVVDSDGRLRTSWNASGTKGGRISSSKTIWKTGLDLQNIPAGRSRGVQNIKHVFIAGKGKLYVKADLAQAETRVVAHILRRIGDSTLYDLYDNGDFDIHKWMAAFIFREDISEVSSDERDIGKLSNHSGNYMAGPRVLMTKALKDGLDIDYAFAKHILDMRSAAIPGLEKWWKIVEMIVRRTRTMTTCLGRRRIFFGRFDDVTFRDAVSFEPQSVVGDLCNMIFWKLDEQLDEDCRLVSQVHDEVIVELPVDKVKKVIELIKRVSRVPLWVCSDVPLIIPIDLSIGKNWKDCKAHE